MDTKKHIITLAALNLGASSLIMQVILLREMINGFYGNELFIGLILALWLVSAGLGSLWLAKFFGKNPAGTIVAWHLFLPFLFAAAVVAIRLARASLSGAGVMPPLAPALAVGAAAIFPVGLALGASFVLLAKMAGKERGRAVSGIYIVECFGFLAGAVFFDAFLYRLPALTAISLLAVLSLALAAGLAAVFRVSGKIVIPAAIFLVAGLACVLAAGHPDRQTLAWQFKDEAVKQARNTRFGSVVVTETAGQTNFYYNGRLAATSRDDFGHELLAHPAMMLAENTERVLVAGNGFSGIIGEIKKYGSEKIVYLEPDEEYYRLVADMNFGADPGAEVVFGDPRPYLRNNAGRFDVVLINYTNPETLAGNRFFTGDFFRLVDASLAAGGIMAVKLDAAPNYLVGAQRGVLGTFYRTLKSVFPHVLVLPDDEVLFLASASAFDRSAERIRKKYARLGLANDFFDDNMIIWRLTNDRAEILARELEKSGAAVNMDIKPVMYSRQIGVFLEKTGGRSGYAAAAVIILAGFAVLAVVIARYRGRGAVLLLAGVAAEFGLMALEVILALWFTAVHGYLYSSLALIIAFILAGLAGGAFVFDRLSGGEAGEKKLLRLSFSLIAVAFVLPGLILWLARGFYDFQLTFYFLALIMGFAAGTKFPLMNKIILRRREAGTGIVYGLDLAGAAAGALFTGAILLPVLGVAGGLAFAAGLGLVSVVFVLRFVLF